MAFVAQGVALLAVVVVCGTARAQPSSDVVAPTSAEPLPVYCLDPVHTRVALAIDHAGFSKALGTVSGSTGELYFDSERWAQAQVRVSVPLARLDFGDAKWNKAVLAGNLLDAERHPSAVFVSERVEALDAGRAQVHGMLTLRGVARPVVLEVALNAQKRHPLPPFRRTVGFSARTYLSRKAFGIDAWPNVIGDEVELRIEAEATRGSNCDEEATAPANGEADGKAGDKRSSLDAAGRDATDPTVPASDSGTRPSPATEPNPTPAP
jgi:polyisoprenoid-binding protein YceI